MPVNKPKSAILQSRKKEIKVKSPDVTMLYDDALPTNLKLEGVIQNESKTLNLRTDNKMGLSPYIIHLSREDEVKTEIAKPDLQALASSFIIDSDDTDDVTELEINDLSIDQLALAAQLQEPDVNFQKISKLPKKEKQAEEIFSFTDFNVAGEPLNIRDEMAPITVQESAPVIETIEVQVEIEEPQTIETGSKEKRTFSFKPKMPRSIKELFQIQFPFPVKAQYRAIVAFTLLSFALVLPLHAMQSLTNDEEKAVEITNIGQSAIENLMRGATALEADRFDVAGSDFARASENFADAEESLEAINKAVTTIASVIPQTDKTYDSVKGLVTAGRNLSDAATTLAKAGDEISNSPSTNLVTKLSILRTYVESVLPNVEEAAVALEDVDASAVPADYQDIVIKLKATTPQLANSMEEFLEFSDALVTIMGADRKMRYLVTFQNNTELRATGGFIGSYAQIDLLNGAIDSINIPGGGTYDVQGQLTEFVASPEPLSLLNPRWEFHDSNWFADFPSSAKKMIWFYEKAGGPTVDGVISINASLMPKLLEILGPIEMDEYGRTIDSENFLFETQKIVEFEYSEFEEEGDNKPKQFIADLAPKILERLESADLPTMLAALDLLGTSLVEKDVLLYFDNNTLQAQMEELGWSGSLKSTSGDYLMIVNTNLGGGKTDNVIDQKIDLQIDVLDDGTVENTLTITKEHRGLKSTLFEGYNNVDYLRVYVPRGSKFIAASGFEIPPPELFEESEVHLTYDQDLALIMSNVDRDPMSGTDQWDEGGKTVFGNWMQTAPGETETVTIKYTTPVEFIIDQGPSSLLDMAKERLGFKHLEPYTLLIQKQPGVETRNTTVSLNLPETSKVIWGSGMRLDSSTEIIVPNTKDSLLQFLIEHQI
ncbi:MAG: DUF4012 domain-containing protein [Candidatus Uhrbacteria bacterium]|nr:DUF4012 domain-containing protein [Candidatus Uhrbacteria bacterium]